MLLIYTNKITPRCLYAFKQVCTRILDIPISFATKVEDFVAHEGMKMSYTKQPLGNEFHVQCHDILFEQGLSDFTINVQKWGDTKCFFKVGEKSELPFDIFGASFFLLSRYEEYLPHVKDDFGRFPAHESIAYKNGFLQKPVVDIWAHLFSVQLEKRFPQYSTKNKDFKFVPVFDVPMAYRYKNKGLVRGFAGTFRDIYKLQLKSVVDRFRVLLGLKRDPYDTFKWIINHHKKRNIKPLFFFLLGDFSSNDRNISHRNTNFRSLMKSVADYAHVGLKVSFEGLTNIKSLKKEKLRIENILNKPLEKSRNSFSKLNLPFSYRNLVDLEVKEDFTMGYISELGFRAGTCTPFYFYDLDYEIQTPLKINSFLLLDYLLVRRNNDQFEVMAQLLDEVKKVGGEFVLIFHNYTFSEYKPWNGFRKNYLDLLNHIH